MKYTIDETHDASRRSWVESANESGCDFPIQNLPFCVFEAAGAGPRGGVGIGDAIVDLRALAAGDILDGEALAAARAASGPVLNDLMALPPSATGALRKSLSDLLCAGGPGESRLRERASSWLVPMKDARFHVPSRIGGYTDFLTSRYHTERNGRLKGLAVPLPPACLSLPVAYNGRVSSIRISGTDVAWPRGQYKDASGQVVYGPAVAMDFELEMGAYVRQGNELAEPVSVAEAPGKIFGLSLFNDWSAKDIQWWEQVLGPFLGKSFMTSVSPWIVTMEALAPFRCAAEPRLPGDPEPLAHLHDAQDQAEGAFDVMMEAWIASSSMRQSGVEDKRLARAPLRSLYWTFAQMLSHHTSNGCNLQAGDLFGSGTVSGADKGTEACMTEITEAGRQPVPISPTESRGWLQAGDRITFKARAERDGYVGIGFGECVGTLKAPA